MKKQYTYLPAAAIALTLSACSTPKQDTSALKAEIDAAMAGHYGQSMLHEELAEENLETANEILEHWEKDYYWNIDEKQAALEAAQAAAQHRLQSEKEMCAWLTEVHSQNHHHVETIHETVAYFKSGSHVPFKTKEDTISHIGHFLHDHPDATATVTASTDTVGKPAANQALSEKRAKTVSELLINNGARASQLIVKAIGEAGGPDNTADQKHRVAVVISAHPDYIDCPKLK
ncbi:OmpA family protein [Methylomonas sp. DH-1]|uniref:OmpA family protein n=1 Tax=Methylomonas sp. (strain DH-1) TaxID=1727196 RepID=UPI0007C888A3|nr:OmpA family protein [Methylomonas sp. DH-1]ANE57250.1 flagellar motor protein MotB [Methylomonas sp. DH-1]